jgi:GntR family transcriptional regulator
LIADPIYVNGKLLPKEVDLAKQMGISRTTLRLALNKLVYEGLLIRKKGIGTKVTGNVFNSISNNSLSFEQEMRARGISIKNYELHVSWVYPDEVVTNFFQINNDKKVLKLERLKGGGENPFVYFVSYFHPRVQLTGDEDLKRPLNEILEDYKVVPNLLKEDISAKAAPKFIAEKLEIQQGEPILLTKRFVYDQVNKPILYNLGYFKADSFVYTIESRRN